MELKIRAVYDEHEGRCGYRRITAALCRSIAEPVRRRAL
ncbi:IS3 family transposase [Hydrogenophaga sp.]|nr:IS3 family transposase [Hydrogenophaga sp.]